MSAPRVDTSNFLTFAFLFMGPFVSKKGSIILMSLGAFLKKGKKGSMS